MHAMTGCINIADLQSQPFAQAQPHAVHGEIEHPVAQRAGRRKQRLSLLDRDDVGQALRLGWFDEVGHAPGFTQNMQGVELEAIQIELDRAPGMRGNQVAEVVGQLRWRQVVNSVVKVVTHAPDGARISIDGLGLQALELEVFEVGLVALIKISSGTGFHAVESSRNIAKSPPSELKEVNAQNKSCQRGGELLRVAASSNLSLERTATGKPVSAAHVKR